MILLENEQQRVTTWLNPLDPSKRHGPGHTVRPINEVHGLVVITFGNLMHLTHIDPNGYNDSNCLE